eukprot:Gregarina_sp_Pseudo_9__101@NODE_1067_length_1909_cov_7_188770_g999_i0_p2_GENE_NODE_1067_length_1909_cov_7_188770_g999_i0NODE_1067_length_1909_cov_7_188770_g999_i0_p2_ORF_typecomplete_len147_score24_43Herpes_gE/PF02480_16/7e05Alpha_GJ/PF03229_13/0_001TMEM154/PF15102_6/0_0037TMEM51/PF15345_6/0_0064CD34_antigen/PF06365_12/0_022PRIMA1/PF16101_5/0_18LapA_dom/PF06305_11/4e03LapA_dom/PF06305_11/0_27Vpu/PF00558_19/6_2e03Vpu/PF00558_19/0_32_NODE_1067_length_1909_cov_7_188770_g999_i014681908
MRELDLTPPAEYLRTFSMRPGSVQPAILSTLRRSCTRAIRKTEDEADLSVPKETETQLATPMPRAVVTQDVIHALPTTQSQTSEGEKTKGRGVENLLIVLFVALGTAAVVVPVAAFLECRQRRQRRNRRFIDNLQQQHSSHITNRE